VCGCDRGHPSGPVRLRGRKLDPRSWVELMDCSTPLGDGSLLATARDTDVLLSDVGPVRGGVSWPGRVVSVDGSRALVEVAGERIPAERGECGEGDEVFLFFRPEWVEVSEGPFTAEIESAEYLGDRWELRARFYDLPLVLVISEAPPKTTFPFAVSAAQAIRRQ